MTADRTDKAGGKEMTLEEIRKLVDENLELRRKIRQSTPQDVKVIRRGMSKNMAGVSNSTPIVVIEGSSPPTLEGKPYLKTHFQTAYGFETTLYTPSSLRIEVGAEWVAKNL